MTAMALGTPLAEALSSEIQPKLIDIGWTVGGEDSSPLSEYICLMLVNGKSREQIAQELSGDLLGLEPDDASATAFANWLFDKVEELQKAPGGANGTAPDPEQAHIDQGEMQDDIMQEDESNASAKHDEVPNAPKAMRGGPNKMRLMNQLSKAMERRPEDALHRVRAQPSERVERPRQRDPPRGPSSNRPNFRGGGAGSHRGHNGRMASRNGFQGPMPMFAGMNPQQQMAFMQMMQQNPMMFNVMAGGMPAGRGGPPFPPMGPNGASMGPNGAPMGPNGGPMGGMMGEDAYGNNFAVPQRAPPGASLFDRIETPPDMQQNAARRKRFNNNNHNYNHNNGFGSSNGGSQDGMGDASSEVKDELMGDDGDAMDENKPEETPCRFGTHCTKADCIFGHPPPAAAAFGGPQRTYISGEKCPFGAGCKNRKCTGSHPSPASANLSAVAPRSEQDCRYFPNCTNPACPYKHPSMPPCRFGANCTRPDCHFTHDGATASTTKADVPCKFHPCLNPTCGFKHEEGQQQAAADPAAGVQNKVWVNNRRNVFDRRFTTADEGEEELILPGQGAPQNGAKKQGEEDAKEGGGETDMDTAPVDEIM